LEVEGRDSRVTVHGYTSTYYVKQLAIQAILDALGSPTAATINVDIAVGRSDERVASATASSSQLGCDYRAHAPSRL
jgi:hypothetical protein